MTDPRRFAPAAARNRGPILDVLLPLLPPGARVLEVASGSGEHARWLAEARPDLVLQPSDPDPAARASIAAWAEGVPNIRPPLEIDAAGDWPALTVDAVVCINMIHIAPWTAAEGLVRGAAGCLAPDGLLYLYGPFRVRGAMAESNAAFDASLRAGDPRWGVRDLEAVADLAARAGFGAPEVVAMPANNLSMVFRRG
ncbi:MAG TPA: DUF938 domain-containing protein [Acetobacteraceae bacterium]|nr:DUF938 domain-containing protein [Acetobacteraceae bacterium]